MQAFVTGAAGFIGSHLCERLLAAGHAVRGVDCFTPYYGRSTKEANLALALAHPEFSFREVDLSVDPLDGLLNGVDVVFHLAAYPGLAKSWSEPELYTRHNLVATQRLLEVARTVKLHKFVYASTSSVYGKFASGDESLPLRPSSPYGITKLAGEQFAQVFREEHGVPTVVLRYFSVYGPRQRPDMGYHLFINRVLQGEVLPLTGDGLQVRGNTYIDDCTAATMLAGFEAMPGEVFNLGGGELTTVIDVIRRIERITGMTANVERRPDRPGDQLATGADVAKLKRHLGWVPVTGLDEGLRAQIEWQRAALERNRG